MNGNLKAWVLGVAHGAAGGAFIAVADALADVLKGAPIPPIEHLLAVSVAGAFVGGAFFLRQPPRDVWTEEQRQAQAGAPKGPEPKPGE